MLSKSEDNIKRLLAKDPTGLVLIDQIVGDFNYSEKSLRNWKQKLVTYYELYQMVQKKKHYDGLAKIFVPEILRAVETLVAKMYGLVFSQPDFFEYASRHQTTDDEGACIALTQLTQFQMDENGFRSRVMDSLRQMVIAGLTVRKILWDLQEVERRINIKGDDGKETVKKFTDIVKDTWTFEPVDLLTFHISDIDVPYNDLQKARWIGEQYLANEEWIDAKTDAGWFCETMEESLEEGDNIKAPTSQSSDAVRNRLNSSGFTDLLDKPGQVEILERWGLLEAKWVMSQEEMAAEGLDEDDMVETVVVIANRQAVLKLERNPFYHNQKPYVACPYIPKEFELPGIGVAQIGETLQEEINDSRNQTMDNKTLVLATMWLKSKASGIKNQDLTIRPNGVIATNDMNGLLPLRPPVVTGVGTNMEAVAKNDLRESAGAASNLQGIAQSGVSTATESSLINRESLGRILLTAQLYGELIIKPTLIFAEYLNYQFYDHSKVIRVVGPAGVKFRRMTPDEIQGGNKEVIVKIALDQTENPSILRQQLMNFFTILQPMAPQQIAFHWKLLDKMYGQFFSGHKLSEIYPDPNANPDEQLTPEEERDIVLQEEECKATNGQDHKKYIRYHEKEFNSMKYALTPMQFKYYTGLIHSHYELLQKEVEAQHQMMAQAGMAELNAQTQDQGSVPGTTPNATPFTQTGAPTVESLRKDIGG